MLSCIQARPGGKKYRTELKVWGGKNGGKGGDFWRTAYAKNGAWTPETTLFSVRPGKRSEDDIEGGGVVKCFAETHQQAVRGDLAGTGRGGGKSNQPARARNRRRADRQSVGKSPKTGLKIRPAFLATAGRTEFRVGKTFRGYLGVTECSLKKWQSTVRVGGPGTDRAALRPSGTGGGRAATVEIRGAHGTALVRLYCIRRCRGMNQERGQKESSLQKDTRTKIRQ